MYVKSLSFFPFSSLALSPLLHLFHISRVSCIPYPPPLLLPSSPSPSPFPTYFIIRRDKERFKEIRREEEGQCGLRQDWLGLISLIVQIYGPLLAMDGTRSRGCTLGVSGRIRYVKREEEEEEEGEEEEEEGRASSLSFAITKHRSL